MREWLYNLRTKNNMTQAQIAEKLSISEAYYSYIEKGERQKKMDVTLIAKLAVIFSLKTERIVQLEVEWNAKTTGKE